jgi:hypothetical protein
MPAGLEPELAAALAALPRLPNGSLLDLTDIPALRKTLAAAAELPVPAPDPRVAVTTHVVVRARRHPARRRPVPPAGRAGAGSRARLVPRGRPGHGLPARGRRIPRLAGSRAELRRRSHRLPARAGDTGARRRRGRLPRVHLLEHAGELGIAPARISIADASGGGAPAAATALMIRDHTRRSGPAASDTMSEWAPWGPVGMRAKGGNESLSVLVSLVGRPAERVRWVRWVLTRVRSATPVSGSGFERWRRSIAPRIRAKLVVPARELAEAT